MRALLDTCTFLWVASGSPRLSAKARELVRDPANDVLLSAVSAWEISIKVALGRLEVPGPPGRFVPEARERLRIESLSLDEESVLQVSRLPDHHRDPFDRALICQAIVHGLVLLTPDPAIGRYAVRTAW